jgi:hypothetical protein
MITKTRRKESEERLREAMKRLEKGDDIDRGLVEDLKVCFCVIDGLEDQVSLWAEVADAARFQSRTLSADLQDSKVKVAQLRRRLFELEKQTGETDGAF